MMDDTGRDMVTRRQALTQGLPGNIIFLIIVCVFCSGLITPLLKTPRGDPKFPQLTGRVVDDAQVLDSGTIDRVTHISEALEHKTGAQLVTVTVPDLQGNSIEDFGYQLGRFWGIGRKGYDDGVLLIVAPNDHEMRIEVGYGLEGVLTDAAASVIVQQDILPRFKEGALPEGVEAGAKAIAGIIGDPDNKDDLPQGNVVAPVKTFHESGNKDWPAFGFLLIPLLFGLFPLIQIACWIRSLFDAGFASQLVPRPRRTSGRWGGGGGTGGSSGGGFSGGGGSFGGGGSSGRW